MSNKKFVTINLHLNSDSCLEDLDKVLGSVYKEVTRIRIPLPSSIARQTFVLTGKMPKKRDQITDDIQRKSGHVQKTVTHSTNYLVDSNDGITTTKLQQAREKGTKIISYNDLYRMLSEPQSPDHEELVHIVSKENLYVLDLTGTLKDTSFKVLQFKEYIAIPEPIVQDTIIISPFKITDEAEKTLLVELDLACKRLA